VKNFLIVLILLFGFQSLWSQEEEKKSKYIQFSGKVVSEDENGEVTNLPYVAVGIVGTSRGTYSEFDGFFSLVAAKGDTIRFSSIGYRDAEIVVPDTLNSVFYSWIQIMSKDSVLLPEAVIFPWPDREHYKIEFLAMDVSDELNSAAKENIAGDIMVKIRETLPVDGGEAFDLEFRKQLNDYKYSGQYKPQNIFSPVAWAQFIKAWKRGDYKRKKDKDK